MAKKGDLSKNKLTEAILGLYPNNAFVQDKNIYINFTEAGERVQIKLSFTIPKEPVNVDGVKAAAGKVDGWDWAQPAKTAPAAEITETEIKNLQAMLEKLGL